MDPIEIITQFYTPGSRSHEILIRHGRQVAEKALAVGKQLPDLRPDLSFLHEAAMLHDIGIFLTRSPSLGCFGRHPYVCHGVEGRALLEHLGFPRHARVCERHVGVGITIEDIRGQNLPLPLRDMTPRSLEEEIICFADKFFSKNGLPPAEKSTEEILHSLAPYGPDKVGRFKEWMERFGA